MTIQHAGAIHDQLREALGDDRLVILDGQRISHIDAAILQLLVTFAQDARGHQCRWHWRDPSEALREASRLLGLSTALGVDQVHADAPTDPSTEN
ncbi:MAG: lipid asymmetry maintenance protein MlaB [Bradymonadia bacterium]